MSDTENRKYIADKIVTARPATRGEVFEERGLHITKCEWSDEGYRVVYHDGDVGWCPKATFEKDNRPCDAMPFGLALEALKNGHCVARAGWNGKGMFVYHVPANAYEATTEAAKLYYGGSKVPYNAYLAIKNVNETVSTWVPSINDCLADDWMVVE